jgi:hypothetical protein
MTSHRSPFRPQAEADRRLVERLRRLSREFILSMNPRIVAVQSWCRICGRPALVKISSNYERAVTMMHRLDDSSMDHEDHAEVGGWGVHWRLDDVLHLVFPADHLNDLFPIPSWYPYDINHSLEVPVRKVQGRQEGQVSDLHARVIAEINRLPQSREMLERQGPVWNEWEMMDSFDVLGSKPPFVVVRRRADGAVGRLLFQREPRLYFGFSVERIL